MALLHDQNTLNFRRKFVAGLILYKDNAKLLPMNVQSPMPFPGAPRIPEQVTYDRTELAKIMTLYGRMVATGKWRDYDVSFLKDAAIFAIFKSTADHPLYRIEKRPKLRRKHGMFAVIGANGQVLKRGHDLKTVLSVLERKLIRAVN